MSRRWKLADKPHPFVVGITIDQVDKLDRLIRTIAANGDVIVTGGAAHLDDQSLPALGECVEHPQLLRVITLRGVAERSSPDA